MQDDRQAAPVLESGKGWRYAREFLPDDSVFQPILGDNALRC